MEAKKTTVFSNSMIWFGAAVSIAEIMTGTLIAPLGFQRGLLAIILGHIIGCALLFAAGLIGAKSGKSAMETVKMAFGKKGSLLFSLLNVLQLVGWTAVMIIGGARAAGAILNPVTGLNGEWVWCLVIGALIILWVAVGLKHLGKINIFAMSALFILTIVLSSIVFKGNAGNAVSGTIGFGAAVELSAAMPISWLPLISDYTKDAKRGVVSTAASSIVYFFASCWMYVIGLGAAIFTAQSDIAGIFLQAGLGIAGVFVIIFSTVTTTFLDVYSAGVSCSSISSRLKEKPAAIVVCILGTALAILTPIEQYESFLYLISSVFAPMIGIQIVSFFLLRQDFSTRGASSQNLAVWLAGFILYQLLNRVQSPIGTALPVILASALLCLAANLILQKTAQKMK